MDVSSVLPDRATAARWAACMRAQDFAGAWTIADAVLARRDRSTRDDPSLPYHLRWVWDGTAPDGRDVLVRCYHGLGDTLHFARFLPALRARASWVTLEAQPELCPMLAGLPGVDRLVPFDTAAPLPPGGCDMEVMELGHVLRVDAGQAAGSVPYLSAPPCRDAEAWGAVGLCWQAGAWDPARSIDLADLLAAVMAPGRRLVSLQRGAAAGQAVHPGFINPCDDDSSVERTAVLVGACGCVVTVDTMVAHLAGALGRPVFLLLRAEADWRWPDCGGVSAWYPTARVLRQRKAGDWSDPLRELAALLGGARSNDDDPG